MPVSLLPEIWSTVFRHLKRDPPAPHSLSVPSEIYHQNDLASCMRLNQSLHDIAGSVLYQSVYVYSLEGLFYGLDGVLDNLDSTPNSSASSLDPFSPAVRLDKEELLGLTKSLNLLYRPSPLGGSLNDILVDNYWKAADPSLSDIDSQLYTVIGDELMDIGVAWQTYYRYVERERALFKRLVSVSLGMVDDGLWEKIEAEGTVEKLTETEGDYSQLYAMSKGLVFEIISNPTVVDVCFHTLAGPFSLPPENFFEPGSKVLENRTFPPTVIYHVKPSRSPLRLPPLFVGCVSAICLDLSVHNTRHNPSAPHIPSHAVAAEEIGKAYVSAIQSSSELDRQIRPDWIEHPLSKLHLIGFTRHRTLDDVRNELLRQHSLFAASDEVQKNQIKNTSEEHADRFREFESNTVRAALEKYILDRGVSVKALKKINIGRMNETPLCLACGYDPVWK